MRYTDTLPPRCSAGHQFHPGSQNKRWGRHEDAAEQNKTTIINCLLAEPALRVIGDVYATGTLSKRRQITLATNVPAAHRHDSLEGACVHTMNSYSSSHLVKGRDDGVTREASIGNAELLRENLRSGGDHPLRQQCFKRGLLHPQKRRQRRQGLLNQVFGVAKVASHAALGE